MSLLFICQITEDSLKVIKYSSNKNSPREFTALEAEDIPDGLGDRELAERLIRIFRKLDFKNNPVIVSLPRNKATCRYLKVPTRSPQEIEKIASLQAPRYLPYPAEELITAYQLISTDSEGYSGINLVIVHKDAIQRYINIFKELNPSNLTIALSSFGLIQFYDYIKGREAGAVMIIDIDSRQAELVITSNQKLLFSRSFRVDVSTPGWNELFISEVNKSRSAYLKEVTQSEPLGKIMIIGAGKNYEEFTRALDNRIDLPVEALTYEKINLSQESLNRILASRHSFASLVGLALKEVEVYLNLLPRGMKEKAKRFIRRNEQLKLMLFILAITLMFGLGTAKNLENKARYLEQLKRELNKIAQEVKPIEDIEKRLGAMGKYSQKKPSVLDALYELQRLMPSEASLVNFIYEESSRITLRGQTRELNSVFAFVSQLEKSPVFKGFSIKVRYATKKNTPAGEIIDFEIAALYKE